MSVAKEKDERFRIVLLVMVILTCVGLSTPSCDTATFVVGSLGDETTDDGVGGGDASAGGEGGAAAACSSLGGECEHVDGCCEGTCVAGVCQVPVPACAGAGESCVRAGDCCSLSCRNDVCALRCTSDEQACATGDECCSGTCEGGTCSPLSSACLTSGNACDQNGDCCSGLCQNGSCSRLSSFCVQESDTCFSDAECCTQRCEFTVGLDVGTCGPPPSGASFCSGVAGTVCDGCNDCCSRLCVPFGPGGTNVCAQARGCRQTGELCRGDLDCCGGDPDSTLPGAGNVSCDIPPGQEWGICRNAQSCTPQGTVCFRQNYACSVSAASNRCCGSDGSDGVCLLDEDDVPRCNGLGSTCLVLGEQCALSEDCCEGACLPDADGRLICQEAGECQGVDEVCTATSECCAGSWCRRQQDAPFGRCADAVTVECALGGQLCGGAHPECCFDLTCTLGRCRGEMQ